MRKRRRGRRGGARPWAESDETLGELEARGRRGERWVGGDRSAARGCRVGGEGRLEPGEFHSLAHPPRAPPTSVSGGHAPSARMGSKARERLSGDFSFLK